MATGLTDGLGCRGLGCGASAQAGEIRGGGEAPGRNRWAAHFGDGGVTGADMLCDAAAADPHGTGEHFAAHHFATIVSADTKRGATHRRDGGRGVDFITAALALASDVIDDATTDNLDGGAGQPFLFLRLQCLQVDLRAGEDGDL